MHPALKSFVSTHKYSRSLTLSQMSALSEEQWQAKLDASTGSMAKQFRHLGLVQFAYRQGIINKVIDFGLKPKDRISLERPAVKAFLEEEDRALFALLEDIDKDPWEIQIDWFGHSVDLLEHLFALAQHESLHFGEWAMYAKVCGFNLSKPMLEGWFVDCAQDS